MKNFLITFLGIAFLLPALASAGSYCVTLPESGDNIWTKRDNDIGVRFRYDYTFREVGYLGHGPYDPDYFATVGVIGGRGNQTNHQTKSYTKYSIEPRGDLCVYEPLPYFGPVIVSSRVSSSITSGHVKKTPYLVPIIEIRADIKWGKDCPTVTIKDDLITGGDHKFEIYRRTGDIVFPWGCRKK